MSLNSWSLIQIVIHRLLSEKWISIAKVVGLVATVALCMCIPLFTDAVYYQVLLEKLSTRYDWNDSDGDFTMGTTIAPRARTRPPFTFTYRYTGQIFGAVDWEAVQDLDQYMITQAGPTLGLPEKLLVRHYRTGDYKLVSASSAFPAVEKGLTLANFAFTSDFDKHVELIGGKYPTVPTAVDGPLEVLISETLMDQLAILPGDVFQAVLITNPKSTPVNVRVSGVWRARDPNEDYWFYEPASFSRSLIIPEQAYKAWLSPQVHREVYLAVWYFVMDGSNVHTSDVARLLDRMNIILRWERYYLYQGDMDPAIGDALRKYQQEARRLTLLLYSFAVPVFGLLLVFILMLCDLAVARQQNEISVMRSRGASSRQIVGMAVIEAALLSGPALVFGIPLALGLTYLMSRTGNFLNFTLQPAMRVTLTREALWFGLGALIVVVVAQAMPTLNASRQTIVSYKREQARSMRVAWWQRMGLDLLLLIPTIYGFYLLRNQGSLVLWDASADQASADLFQNPILFLAPTLGICSVTLFILRLFPFFMVMLNRLTARLGGTGLFIASNHLARSPGFYHSPVILLVWTLSLAIFTASLAQVLDRNFIDQTFYHDGADMTVLELGQSANFLSGDSSGTEALAASAADDSSYRSFPPFTDHLRINGIEAAARVGSYKAVYRMGGDVITGSFIGIDRVDFPRVAFWRPDFAQESLGSLMNRMATNPESILLPREFMVEQGLRIGDRIILQVDTYTKNNELELLVVGTFDLFPTWYPQIQAGSEAPPSAPIYIGNLDYLFEQAGGQFPHAVWLKLQPGADYNRVLQDIQSLDFGAAEWRSPQITILREKQRPERQGLFGLLSISFLTTTFLTVIGFFYYTFFSFRRRYIQLGVLRAIGLSSGQLTSLLAWEMAFLIIIALATGTGLGLFISDLYIPFLQFGSGLEAKVPPFVIEIAWPTILLIYGLFGILLVIALVGLVALLLRLKMFEALKLGETQ